MFSYICVKYLARLIIGYDILGHTRCRRVRVVGTKKYGKSYLLLFLVQFSYDLEIFFLVTARDPKVSHFFQQKTLEKWDTLGSWTVICR
mgnify:CR=1 FL=1